MKYLIEDYIEELEKRKKEVSTIESNQITTIINELKELVYEFELNEDWDIWLNGE